VEALADQFREESNEDAVGMLIGIYEAVAVSYALYVGLMDFAPVHMQDDAPLVLNIPGRKSASIDKTGLITHL